MTQSIQDKIGPEQAANLKERLQEILMSDYGAIILIGYGKEKNPKVTDYYQNICATCVTNMVEQSATDFAKKYKTIAICGDDDEPEEE